MRTTFAILLAMAGSQMIVKADSFEAEAQAGPDPSQKEVINSYIKNDRKCTLYRNSSGK